MSSSEQQKEQLYGNIAHDIMILHIIVILHILNYCDLLSSGEEWH